MAQKSTKKAAGKVDLACSDGLSNEMWVKTEDVRQKILQTAFVQGIGNGTLNPTTFGRYMIQYVVLSYKTQGFLERFSAEYPSQNMEFFRDEARSFSSHYKKLWDDWKIGIDGKIELGEACREYADYLQTVVDEKGSSYFIVALLAATRLWPWLGEQLNGKPIGVYSDWCDEHFNPNSTIYENLQKRVDAMVGMELIDKYKATDVYAHCMDGEFAFFDSLTPRC